ncbi:disease resistance protein Pik-2 isoform X2 [Triticum aestivum]|uniref:disease resistance protein Pik-2 isoform X2 n=1 Tax=Triticum aestivum TaxID=4565 RepID=UPI001D02CCC4|nr:disease resistance protein Pik-2-like isoform X2 [Triticum aestivum]
MAIVSGTMDVLLPKLAELLTDEFKLHKGLKEEIASLSRELESMQAALVKISEVPVGQLDGQVKVWSREVREMSYDIEDSIDTFTVRFGAAQEPPEPLGLIKGFMDRVRSLWATALTRRQIAGEIQRIKGEVEEVSQRRKRYKLDDDLVRPSAATTIDPRLPALYEDASRLVGMERPTGDLVKWLKEGEGASKRQLKVLSIVGVGGLGKTTLANTVFHMLEGQFQCRAFVSVSLTPDVKKIFRSIIRQVSGEDCTNGEDWDVKELVDHIRNFLKDKRYLIIIDDIWDQNVWTILKVALIKSNCGSRIITTTRKVGVAESCCSDFNGRVYHLAPLSHGDSKKLFYKRIFNCEDDYPNELKEVSEKILKKCDGLPLAIITIASLLASKPTKTNELWYNVLNSIGSGHENGPSVENMRGILSLSYRDLPPHLKTCLLYLSIFPEDHMINRDKLIWGWVAEDFIHDKQRGNLYKQGENYFNELINRNMLQPVDIDTHGSAKTCRVHDMVLDLITSLSAEENFVSILGGQQPLSTGNKIRRLSIQENNGEHNMLDKSMDLSHVRLLFVFRSAIDMIPSLLSFQVLRVLDLEECQHLDSCYLKDITNLLHLRAAGLVFAQEALQGLQRLRFDFGVRETKDLYGDFEFGLENLSSVKRVRIDIDCDGAWVSEVEALEILIKKTTNVYAPILNISRRLEEDMLKHEDIGLANKKEENWPAKNGPWGGNGGRARDIKVAPQSLESVTIRSGSVVDSLAFSFKDGNGRHHTAGPWGSDGGSGKTIKLGPTEFVTEVSGTFGSFGALSNVLTSLTLVTNCGSYGPFGKRQGSPFKTTMQSNSSIVGFFGRAGQFVDAIGVYVLPFPV